MQIREILQQHIGQKAWVAGEGGALDVRFNSFLKTGTLTEVGNELFTIVRHGGKTCYYNIEHVRSIDLNKQSHKVV